MITKYYSILYKFVLVLFHNPDDDFLKELNESRPKAAFGIAQRAEGAQALPMTREEPGDDENRG